MSVKLFEFDCHCWKQVRLNIINICITVYDYYTINPKEQIHVVKA